MFYEPIFSFYSVSKESKEAGVLAMEALHRQVLPFILRRMKEDVLKDLPPKITQDYYCELSPIQQLLYEDFAKEQKDKNKNDKSHIFQALQYLRKVCNHPKLVLHADHKHYNLGIIHTLRKHVLFGFTNLFRPFPTHLFQID